MAQIVKFFADIIGKVRDEAISRPGDLLEHLGGPAGVMEALKDEPELRTKILDGAVDARIAPKISLAAAANALEMALSAGVISPGRVEDVLTPAVQAKVCPLEVNWKYFIRGNWMDNKGEVVSRTLAFTVCSAKTHGLTDPKEIYGLFRPDLAQFLPREELRKLFDRGATDVLTDQVLYETLDMYVVVHSLQRSSSMALIDRFAIKNGIIKLSASVAVVETTEGDDIPADDLQPVDQGWNKSKEATSDDGDPEITSSPVAAGDPEVESALEVLNLDSSPPPDPAKEKTTPVS